jgi:hypothetical protein
MIKIKASDCDKIIDFIKINDLDLITNETDNKFNIISYDNLQFTIYQVDESYVLVRYDRNKDIPNNPSSQAYEYYNFEVLSKLLEQLKVHDESIIKNWWVPILNSAEIGFDNSDENWLLEFITDNNYQIKSDTHSKYIEYNNDKYKPILRSPFNTLHEVSYINDEFLERINKLNFEIHAISLKEGNESYLAKILINNEEILKEYTNFIITRKKGLKLFLNNLFLEMETFKQ